MSKGAAKVSVLCGDKGLCERIRAADRAGVLAGVISDPGRRAIYEYGPALYVHVPQVTDYETVRRKRPPTGGGRVVDTTIPADVQLHRDLEAHGPQVPDFEGMPYNLSAAVREGGILVVAFGEKFMIDATVRQRQRELAGFVTQLDSLDREMERQAQELVDYRNRGGQFLPGVPLKAFLAKLGGQFVHQAYERAEQWANFYHLEGLPPEPPYADGFDMKRARGEFAKLRAWFEASKGWRYSADIFMGLLPVKGFFSASTPGFAFIGKDPPDQTPLPASACVAWVEPLFPFFTPEIMVRVEALPVRKASAQAAEKEETPPLSARETAAARIRERTVAPGPSTEKDTASLYEVNVGEVRIEPLVVNAIGESLGVAVRIRKGAVLVLPECRDAEAKAALVVNLATEQWGAVQEWLASSPKPAQTPAPPPASPTPTEPAEELGGRDGGVALEVGKGGDAKGEQVAESTKQYDAFLCHASEDKDAVVRPFADLMRKHNLKPWLDQGGWGDDLAKKIQEGLARSRFVVVFLSSAFLAKDGWGDRELNAALSMEGGQNRLVLPVVLGITHKQLKAKYPLVLAKVFREIPEYAPPKQVPPGELKKLVEELKNMIGVSVRGAGGSRS